MIGLYGLGNHDLFYVTQVDVGGNSILPQAEIERAANVSYVNVFFIEPHAVQAAIEKLPEVRSVEIALALPSSISIQVLERRPQFIWQSGDKQSWVDEEGLALLPRRSLNLRTVVDLDRSAVEVGHAVNHEAVQAALALQQIWPEGPRVYEWSALHGLGLVEEHGWKVYFGDYRQMPEKLGAFRIVAQSATQSGRKITFIDLGNGLPYFQEATLKK